MRTLSPIRRSFSTLRRASALLGMGLALAACGDDDGNGPDGGASNLTVSGTLSGPQLAALPEGAKVVVIWAADDGDGDYGYVYGGGTIDRANGRFTLNLPSAPPAEALNHLDNYSLGVGLIAVLKPGINLPNGRYDEGDLPESDFLGAAGQYAIIYTGGSPSASPADWAKAFPRGYAVGRGITIPDDFDGFEPVAANSVQVTIDDLNNIDFVNWT